MSIAAKLSTIELSDWEGKSHPLGELWREHPVVLVFIRHFG